MYRVILNVLKYSLILCCFTLLLFSTESGIASDDLSASKRSLYPVTLQLKWKHQFQFAGYYAALEKGFYREAGLDVRILEITDGEESIDTVLEGKADFGIAMSDLILHRAKGQPVVALAAIFQHSPLILLTSESKGIDNIHALKGKRLGMEAHSGELFAYIENEGVTLEKNQLVDHDYSISSLISGKVDAISAYSTDEPFILLDRGIRYSSFTPRAGGIDFYGDTLFTSEAQISEHPERVAAFLTASLQGWHYALENSEEIVDLILSKYTQRHSREHLLFEAHHSKSLIMADVVQLGYMHIGRWNHIAQTYAKLGMVDESISLDGFLYAPDSVADYGWLKRIIGTLVIICLLLGLGALMLAFLNRKFAFEVNERKQSEKINNVLFSISNAVNISNDLDDLYRKIHHFVGEIIDVTNFFIAAVNERKKTLYFPYYVDSVDKDFSPITNFDPEKSLTGFVVTNRKPLLIKEKQLQLLAKKNGVWGPVPLVWMGVPLVVRNEIIGVMAVQSYTDPHLYDERDLEVLVSISDQMAIAIDRKGTENELIKSEKKYRYMMESFIDPLYICSPDFKVEYMNPRMLNLIGHDVTGEHCYSGIYGLNSKCEWCVFDQGIDTCTIETDLKSLLNGRNYSVISMPVQNSDGTVSQMITLRDVTDYLNTVLEKEKAQKQLQQTQKMESIGNLAGGIAHDFNNILSSIIGFTELALESAPKGSSQKDDLEEVYIAGNRAKELVQQILAFARQSEKETKPVRLSDIITEILKLLRPSTPTTIDIKSTINSTVKVMGNNSQLHQIVMNICTNAIHSLQKSGDVLEITLRDIAGKDSDLETSKLPSGDYVELTITDNGPGIDAAIIEKIFEPYFTTKGVGEGSGMGLAMVKGIVESYGGDIHVQSELGKKTSFTIRFPVATGISFEKLDKVDPVASGTERILFVDDEPPIARMGSRMLESLGYKVTIRTSSFEALELFKEKPHIFDMVITDMTMPFMTGDLLTIEMRKIRNDIPIILCTGYSNKINEEGAKQIGIDAFAYKPFTKPELAKTIRKVLDAE